MRAIKSQEDKGNCLLLCAQANWLMWKLHICSFNAFWEQRLLLGTESIQPWKSMKHPTQKLMALSALNLLLFSIIAQPSHKCRLDPFKGWFRPAGVFSHTNDLVQCWSVGWSRVKCLDRSGGESWQINFPKRMKPWWLSWSPGVSSKLFTYWTKYVNMV